MKENPVQILMIDDDEDDFFLVSSLLEDISPGQYKMDWAPTYASGLEEINKKRHGIYLVDYRLGPYTGIDILHHFQQLQFKAPVIMLTGKGDYAIDKEAMLAGASDYLVKGEINADQLERSIRYALDESNHLRIIEESERKYYGVFEKSHDLIFMADCDKNIIDANPAALRILKYSKDEILQLNLRNLFFTEEQSTRFIDGICEEGGIVQEEFDLKNKEGIKLNGIINAVKLDEEAQIFLCVVQDITEKKKEEQEKQQQQKFVITGRIARVIAHEVRNPLTNILLAVSQFKTDPPSFEDSQLYVDIIERNCTRINQLITEMLHSTRMVELNIEHKGINELVDKTLLLANDRIQLNEIKLIKNYTTPDIRIPADEEKVLIALLNIVINAIEAMSPGEGILTINTSMNQNKAKVEITDNGAGIPEENKNKLFDPFFTSKPKGSGLGLTSTHNIIVSHKGTIHVESEAGSGTTFTITLPLSE
ncbi:PAS domain S-box protein [Chitinophaga pendula]|uniref:hybrid sensor histidine kinase/response regulator n=1 Tax=Chitinophaga TaxID=79328 RepID=UPI000BAFAEC6|nr:MULTISPECIES: hybrid sensor histidine kinase/response regulator [Chitinophaga]ASZ10586.1 hybrid sensor histidine kinase/response regulator [Chitinophaga sp. MD30]UCJ06438.1 PAS domain S-box protein [Chitinophaga pendula]